MKSIIQDDKKHCFLCGGSATEHLDEHHIFGGSYRDLSEKYGLKVYLHHNRCHIFGENSVHKNAEIRWKLCEYAQLVAMAHFGWKIEEWIDKFGIDYRGIKNGKD